MSRIYARHYSPQFKAAAVTRLHEHGYPHVRGALTRTARELSVHYANLQRWFHQASAPAGPMLARSISPSLPRSIPAAGDAPATIPDLAAELDTVRALASYKDLVTILRNLAKDINALEHKDHQEAAPASLEQVYTEFLRLWQALAPQVSATTAASATEPHAPISES